MVEELKIAIKVDDDSIEQSLLKQFANAQKMADKVVLDFKNVNFADKEIEAKFKTLQKKADQNPIDLSISKDSIQMLSQISDKLGDIFKIAQGKSVIDSSSTNADIGKIENKLNEFTKKYEDLQKKAFGGISGKEVNLVDNDEFQKLSQEVQNIKSELNDLKDVISNLISDNEGLGNFADQLDDRLRGLDDTVLDLTKRLQTLYSVIEQNPKTNNSNNSSEVEGMKQVGKSTEEAVQAKKDFATANEGVQSSIDESKSPLQLEAELMNQIARSAREAADAKKEFVEANEQVKASADDSNSENKKNRYKNKKKVSEEEFLKDAAKYSSAANGKLSSAGYSILGGSVDSSLITDGLAKGLVKVSAKVKDADGVWRSFSAKVDADGNVIDERFRTITKNVANLNYQLSNYGKDHVRIQETEDQIREGEKLSEVMSRYETIRKRIATGKAYKTDEEEAQSLLATIEKIMGIADGSVTILSEHQLAEAQSRLEKINTIVSDLYQKNISNRINQLTPYDKKLSGYNATLDRFKAQGWASPDYTKNVQAVSDALSNYSNELQRLHSSPELIDREALSGLDDFKKKLDSAIMSVNNMTSAEKGFTALTQQKALRNINQILESNSKMSSQAKAKIRAYYNEIKNGNPSASLDVLLSKIQEIANAEIAAGRGGKSLFAAVKEKAFYGLANTIGTFFGLNDLIQYGKQAANIVTDLNTQITELAKVSEQTSSQIYKDFKSYSDIAENMGATISDTISATADWSRNGYNIPDAKELAEVALLYKNVGDGIDITEANESLISTLKGFKLEADQAEHIIDVFNEVSNNEAIASSGIGAALQRSAASFNAANTSLEKSVALVTATNSVIQDPEKVGNMWKTNLLSLCTEMCA